MVGHDRDLKLLAARRPPTPLNCRLGRLLEIVFKDAEVRCIFFPALTSKVAIAPFKLTIAVQFQFELHDHITLPREVLRRYDPYWEGACPTWCCKWKMRVLTTHDHYAIFAQKDGVVFSRSHLDVRRPLLERRDVALPTLIAAESNCSAVAAEKRCVRPARRNLRVCYAFLQLRDIALAVPIMAVSKDCAIGAKEGKVKPASRNLREPLTTRLMRRDKKPPGCDQRAANNCDAITAKKGCDAVTTRNLQVGHPLLQHGDVALSKQEVALSKRALRLPAWANKRAQYLHFAVSEEHGSVAVASGDLHNVCFIPQFPRTTKAAIYDCAIPAKKHGLIITR